MPYSANSYLNKIKIYDHNRFNTASKYTSIFMIDDTRRQMNTVSFNLNLFQTKLIRS